MVDKIIIAGILFAFVLVVGAIFVFGHKPMKKIITSPEELFVAVKSQLSEKYGLTDDDISRFYTVEVIKFIEPLPPTITVSGKKPDSDKYVYFNVILQSSLYICLPGERLLTNVFVSTNQYGDIVSLSGNAVHNGEVNKETTFMTLNPEKMKIKNQVDMILKENELGSIEAALSPGKENALTILDTSDSITFYKGNFNHGNYHYVYNKADKTLTDVAKARGPGPIFSPARRPVSEKPAPKPEKFLIHSPFTKNKSSL